MSNIQNTEIVYQYWEEAVDMLYKLGLRNVVLSPGSRSAPPALAFLRHKGIQTLVHVDERSAAFIALGMAQTTKKPVAILCTSATAALNYAPAVAEAFFREIPLLVFTADRPPEWTGQADNQAIFQKDIYAKNIKKCFELPCSLTLSEEKQHFFRIISEAWIACKYPEAGSVHVNVPLREPLYLNSKLNKINLKAKTVRYCETIDNTFNLPESLMESFLNSKKVMFIAGNLPPNNNLFDLLVKFKQKYPDTILLTDICSNLQSVPRAISSFENIIDLNHKSLENLKPDLLISFGGPLVSKNLKSFLREHKPENHWHIHPSAKVIDTYLSLTSVIPVSIGAFIKCLIANKTKVKHIQNYANLWHKNENNVEKIRSEYFKKAEFNEIYASDSIINHLPENSVLHISNSLPIRIFSRLSVNKVKNIRVYSNRGTSGIDGSVSTAVGSALAKPEKKHVLVCGDLSFFYDRNGLWNKAMPNNLSIIIFNNNGGGIFRSMEGPAMQDELELYFTAGGGFSAKDTASQHEIEYLSCNHKNEFNIKLKAVLNTTAKSKLLELFFDQQLNNRALADFTDRFKF